MSAEAGFRDGIRPICAPTALLREEIARDDHVLSLLTEVGFTMILVPSPLLKQRRL